MSNRQYYHNNNVVQCDTSQLRSLYFLRETDGKKNHNFPKNSGLFKINKYAIISHNNNNNNHKQASKWARKEENFDFFLHNYNGIQTHKTNYFTKKKITYIHFKFQLHKISPNLNLF